MMQGLDFPHEEFQITCILLPCKPRVCPRTPKLLKPALFLCRPWKLMQMYLLQSGGLPGQCAGICSINAWSFYPMSSSEDMASSCSSLSGLNISRFRSRLYSFFSSLGNRSTFLLDALFRPQWPRPSGISTGFPSDLFFDVSFFGFCTYTSTGMSPNI